MINLLFIISSSCRAISTDIPDPLSPLLLIIHLFRLVPRATPRILTELLYVGASWSPCFCSAMWRGPLEYITYELVPTSPAVSCMSGSSNLDSFRDGWSVAVQLLLCGVLPPGPVQYWSQNRTPTEVMYSSFFSKKWCSYEFIVSGRFSGLHPVSSHSCCMYVRAGRSAFARPYVRVHRSTSLMNSSLLLQKCPACLVRLTWIVFVTGTIYY